MKKGSNSLGKVRFSEWSIPFALLAICVLAFGLLITRLGFYQDDWHFLYYAYTRGAAGLTELLNYDGHPLATPLYIASFKLLGFTPLYWQIYSLFWRWLAVVTFWLVLHRTWPTQQRATFTAAAIYVIYPLFTLQSNAIVYFEVWISHFLLAASFLLTIEAIKQPKRFWLFTALAILLKILHTFSSEYTWGMELVRPVLIWLALPASQNDTYRHRITKTLQIYAPYLIIFGLAFFWRGFLYRSPVLARSAPRMFDAILADPLGGLKRLIFNSIPDITLIMFSTWFQTLNPGMFFLTNAFNLQVIVLIIASTVTLYFYLSRLDKSESEPGKDEPSWLRWAFIVGLVALIFGMLPVYAAGYFVYQKLEPWNGRFVIGSMPGVALITTVFIEALIDAPKKRWLVIALLLSLGIGWQIRSTNNFRWAWDAEANFYRQLVLRAPSIAPHTTFLAEEEFLGLMGDYPTSFAINTIYATPGQTTTSEAKAWLFLIVSNFGGRIEGLLSGLPMEDTKHSTHFIGKSTDSLIINYEPQLGQCLWVITPENADIPIVPGILKDISPLTNLRLIEQSDSPPPFLQTIFPTQPDDWCAYYQRGSLTHQLKDWNKTIALWQEASEKGFHPANGLEYLPFIEAYAQVGNWNQAFELTKTSNKLSKGMENALCSAWSRFQQQTESSPERDNAIVKVKEALGCK